ncbi:eL24 family ribosomal protein [Halocatena halophila]|uniref:hypothetical protein n=1 Tax=Halocatena halophila TaxID=2814576 RepID=UPI002ED3F03B
MTEPCSYCGEELCGESITWDIRVQEPGEAPEPFFARYHFCGEDCKHDAKRDGDWLSGEEEHGSGERIHEEEA